MSTAASDPELTFTAIAGRRLSIAVRCLENREYGAKDALIMFSQFCDRFANDPESRMDEQSCNGRSYKQIG
jgi:hypothetical protein